MHALCLLAVTAVLQVSDVFGASCGRTPIRPNVSGFIVGGVEARPHSLPWQIGLGKMYGSSYGGQICGGSIVSENIVITAAHCISPGTKYYVVIGQHNKNKPDKYTKKIKVTEAITHPSWNDRNIIRYDIAILRLSESITFNDGVQPICIPESGASYADNAKFLVSGWGALKEGGWGSSVLMQLVAPHIPLSTCRKYLGSSVHENVLCAGYLEGGKDSCQGDSGGPLATVVGGKWTLAGVVSWGYGCAQRGKPGVYTKVASYLDFVNKYVSGSGSGGGSGGNGGGSGGSCADSGNDGDYCKDWAEIGYCSQGYVKEHCKKSCGLC